MKHGGEVKGGEGSLKDLVVMGSVGVGIYEARC